MRFCGNNLFAKNQQAFDNKNFTCIQCGICIDVCPMGVLSFSTESSETSAIRFKL